MHDVQQANKEVQKYPEWVLKVLTMEGYIQKWIEFIGEYGNYSEAWEATERFYLKWFGSHRYTSYDSFRVCKKNYLKGKANDSK